MKNILNLTLSETKFFDTVRAFAFNVQDVQEKRTVFEVLYGTVAY